MSNIKVKPLVWREVESKTTVECDKIYRATVLKDSDDIDDILYYDVEHILGGYLATLTAADEENSTIIYINLGFPLLESAKSACQAHFEKFITQWTEVEQ